MNLINEGTASILFTIVVFTALLKPVEVDEPFF
jgi:hypothetical protein